MMVLLQRNASMTVVRELSSRQSSVLKGKDLSTEQETIRQSILASFYLKHWVKCDCKQDGAVMAIRHNSGGSFSLMTIHSHGSHGSACPLFAEPSSGTRSVTDFQQAEHSFNFHRDIKPARDQRARVTADSKSVRQNPLYRLLATLFVKSGLTDLCVDPGFTATIERIYPAAKEVSLAGRPLDKHLFFGFETFRQVKDHIASQGTSWEPSRPHAILIDVVDELTRTDDGMRLIKFFSKANSVDFTLFSSITSVQLHSGRMSLSKGPFVVISTIAETRADSGARFIAPLRCYIAPVLSKANWAIVDSEYERRVARRLVSTKLWYSQNTSLEATVTKPLFYIPTDLKPCLPDFLINTPDHSIVLEVMGSHSSSYLTRKQRTHDAMRCLGELESFDALQADKDGDFDDQCFSAVRHIFNRLKHQSDLRVD